MAALLGEPGFLGVAACGARRGGLTPGGEPGRARMWGCGGQPRTLLGGAIVRRRGLGWEGALEPTGGFLGPPPQQASSRADVASAQKLVDCRSPGPQRILCYRYPFVTAGHGPPSQPPALAAGRGHRGGRAAAAAEGQVRQQGMCRGMRRARAPLGQQAALRVPAGFSFVFPCSGCQSRQASLQRAPQWSHQACGTPSTLGLACAGLRAAVRPPRRRAAALRPAAGWPS